MDSSDDDFHSLSSTESSPGATHIDQHGTDERPRTSTNLRFGGNLGTAPGSAASASYAHTANISNASPSSTSSKREAVRDANSNILSRIKNGLSMPLGIFTNQSSRGGNTRFVPPKSAPLYLGGLGSSESTPRCLSDLDPGFVFSSTPRAELDGMDPSVQNDPVENSSRGFGWPFPPSTTSLSFSDLAKQFSHMTSDNLGSPASLNSAGPSPLFSEADTQSTPPWSPDTCADFQSPLSASIHHRKRQVSIGSIQIKDNHVVRRADGGKGKYPAPPLVSAEVNQGVSEVDQPP